MPHAPDTLVAPRLIDRENGPPIRVLPADCVTQTDAAIYLDKHRVTLVRWAKSGHGPPHFRIGQIVFYPLAGLDAHRRQA